MKVCEICGKEYIPKAPNQKYCSKECRKKFLKAYHKERNQRKRMLEPRTCPVCGKEFTMNVNYQKYCSIECRYKAKLEKDRNRRLLDNAEECCRKHGGIDNCPYPDCIRE